MARRIIPQEKKFVTDTLGPVIAALRTDPSKRNDFLKYAGARGADLVTMGERVRKLVFAGDEAPMPAYFALILFEYGQTRAILPGPRIAF